MRLILKEKKEKGTFESPAKRYKRSRKEVVDYDEEGIRKAIYAMYDRKEHITLNKLLKIVREGQLFFGQRTKLAEILQEMGFHYKKINNRRYYYEQPHIIDQRHINFTYIGRCK